MKKYLLVLLAVSVFFSISCKKNKIGSADQSLGKKYAKYKVAVYKDTELKTWLATLEKAEDVSLLSEEKTADKNNSSKDISKIMLADDNIGYIETRHLADTPIVFTEDTKAFERPTPGSTIYASIPKGELGFIIDEKATWKQVYVGEINGKKFYNKWVEGGFTTDVNTVIEAKQYIMALESLNDKDSEKASRSKETLETLAKGNSLIADLAKKKLGVSDSSDDSSLNTENESEAAEAQPAETE